MFCFLGLFFLGFERYGRFWVLNFLGWYNTKFCVFWIFAFVVANAIYSCLGVFLFDLLDCCFT